MKGRHGVIVAESTYPVGSMSIRIRMWAKGFNENNVDTKIFIVAPRPTYYNLENSESYVAFALSPTYRKSRSSKLLYFYQRLVGFRNLHKFLKKEKNLSFVIMSWPNIMIGVLLVAYCKKNNVRLFFDKGDENARLIDKKNRSLIDYLAKQNQKLFNKYIIPRVNVLYVVSSYLEKKYKSLYPELNVKKSLPTLIDYVEFQNNQNNDINEVDQKGFAIFNSEQPKIFYAGSCERTNGLFFFLESAAHLLTNKSANFEIIFILVDGDIEKIKKFCLRLEISDHVTFLNPVLPKYMPAIYKKVDVLVLPEQGTIIANAGFPGKTGEYLASGKAIIATVFSDLTDYLKHGYNSMLSQIGDKEAYQNNLKRLISDSRLRAELGENALRTALEKFDYKKGVLRYIEEL
jgi:glycosyltransferase involved in cell wall biosynthesis